MGERPWSRQTPLHVLLDKLWTVGSRDTGLEPALFPRESPRPRNTLVQNRPVPADVY